MIELLLCTLIWGISFVVQKPGAAHFGPFSVNCYRNLLAGLFLGGCIRLRRRYFAVQILVVDRFAGTNDMLRFSRIQMVGCGVILLAVLASQVLPRTHSGS